LAVSSTGNRSTALALNPISYQAFKIRSLLILLKHPLTCRSEIIYPRNVPLNARTEVPRPKDFPDYTFSSTEELTLPTPDGESLSAFLLKPTNMVYAKRAPITIIMFHGNAGNIGHRLPVAGVLDQFVDANILMVEYRG